MNHLTHYKALAQLALPIMVGQLGMLLVGFADTIMIGHHSTQELAAASFVNNLLTLAIVTGIGFSLGLTPVVGALQGQKRQAEAGLALKSSLVANTLVALGLIAAAMVLYLFLDRLGQPEELLPIIRPYYLIVTLAMLPVMWFNSGRQFTDGIAKPQYGMWILLAGNGLNILGNWLLINGIGPFPELGLSGAGISTIFARSCMALTYLFLIGRGRRFQRYRVGLFRHRGMRPMVKRLFHLGTPMAMQSGMECASFSLCAILVGWIGTLALASHQIMCIISQFNFMIYLGLGTAVSIRTSHFYGQGRINEVRQTAASGFRLMLLLEVVLSALLFTVHDVMGGWFTDNTEVTAMVSSLFVVFVAYQFGDGMQINYANALRGITDVKALALIAFVAYFLISLPASYLFAFPLDMGLVGVWLGFPFGLTSAGVMLWWRFQRQTKHKSVAKKELV